MNSKTKHIDVVVKYFIPVTAGIETNILETYSVLAEKGWDITIHTSKDTALEKDALSDVDEIRGLKIKRYHFGPFGFTPNIDWLKTDLVCLHNFDIFPHFQIMLTALRLKIKKQKNFKLILTPHGGFNPEWSIFPLIQRTIKWIYHYTLGAILINLSTDGVRAVSDWEMEEMLKHNLSKNLVKVISNGIEKEAYLDIDRLASTEIKNNVKKYGKYLIQIGRIYPIKNYETTIRALYYLPKDINYVIAGPVSDINYQQKLGKLIAQLGLQERVFFIGVVRGIDKYYLIKHAQMMVHMALWESFCNVVHEGMSQGLVCLVANNTALPLLIRDGVNGYCIGTKDYKILANKILYVLENYNTEEIAAIKKRNQEFSLEHSWTKVADLMDEWYSDLIGWMKKFESEDQNYSRSTLQTHEPLVTIGVAAYNAELNIGDVLNTVIGQKNKGFVINRIIVHSDASHDKTVSIAYQIGDPRIEVIDNKDRLGFAGSVIRMLTDFKNKDGDIFVILNDDLKIDGPDFISHLIHPFLVEDNISLTSGIVYPLSSKNSFIEKAAISAASIYDRIRKNIDDSHNSFTYDGATMALSKRFTDSLKFPLDLSEVGNLDGYLFYSTLVQGLKYRSAREAISYFRAPNNLKDYIERVSRNTAQSALLEKTFGDIVTKSSRKPKWLFFRAYIKEFFVNPTGCIFLVIIGIYIRFHAHTIAKNFNPKWEPVVSTKLLK